MLLKQDKPIAVLDTSAFISSYVNPAYENYTVPRVLKELENFGVNFEDTYFSCLINLVEPHDKYLRKVKEAALKTGDYAVLSETDLSLVGLAVELNSTRKQSVTVFTDDYALANLAGFLGIDHSFIGLRKQEFRLLKWVWYCPVCHKVYFGDQKVCSNCGSELKRKPK